MKECKNTRKETPVQVICTVASIVLLLLFVGYLDVYADTVSTLIQLVNSDVNDDAIVIL